MHTFLGGDEFSGGGILHRVNFPLGGKFSGGGEMNFSGEILHWCNLPEFLYEILFICITFSLLTQFYIWKF